MAKDGHWQSWASASASSRNDDSTSAVQWGTEIFTRAAAEEYGKARAHLAAGGTPIDPHDLMIAAIALANRLTVVTNDKAEFSRVPKLSIEDWQ